VAYPLRSLNCGDASRSGQQFMQTLNDFKGKKINFPLTDNETKVSHYLEGIKRFNEMGGTPESNFNNAENVSSGSNNARENGSGSGSGLTGSNMAFLDSTAGHRNISGSNGGSGNGNSGGSGRSNVQFVPILIVCCPNLLKNEACNCGHTSSVQLPVS